MIEQILGRNNLQLNNFKINHNIFITFYCMLIHNGNLKFFKYTIKATKVIMERH